MYRHQTRCYLRVLLDRYTAIGMPYQYRYAVAAVIVIHPTPPTPLGWCWSRDCAAIKLPVVVELKSVTSSVHRTDWSTVSSTPPTGQSESDLLRTPARRPAVHDRRPATGARDRSVGFCAPQSAELPTGDGRLEGPVQSGLASTPVTSRRPRSHAQSCEQPNRHASVCARIQHVTTSATGTRQHRTRSLTRQGPTEPIGTARQPGAIQRNAQRNRAASSAVTSAASN